MKKEKRKIKEPFAPEQTPSPPQIIEPNSRQQRENPVGEEEKPDQRKEEKGQQQPTRHHLLSDDADIDDETTL